MKDNSDSIDKIFGRLYQESTTWRESPQYALEMAQREFTGQYTMVNPSSIIGKEAKPQKAILGPNGVVRHALISHPQGTTFTGYTAAIKEWKTRVYDFPLGKTFSIDEHANFRDEKGNVVEIPTKEIVNDWEATVLRKTGSDRGKDYHLLFYPQGDRSMRLEIAGPINDYFDDDVPGSLREKVRDLYHAVEEKLQTK